MNIGKWSFSDILKVGFDRRLLSFSATVFFVMLLVSYVLGRVSSTLYLYSIGWGLAVEALKVLALVGLSVVLLLGVFILLKASAGRSKKINLWPSIKALFWKGLGAAILFVLSIAVLLLLAWLIGLLARIPYIGSPLMALLLTPAAAAFALLVIYTLVGGKILFAVIADNPQASALAAVQKVIALTLKSPVKLLFNFTLSLLPLLFTALSLGILLFAVLVLYSHFGWSAQGNYEILRWSYALLDPTNVLFSLGTLAVAAYAGAYLIGISAACHYSIYLDAK